MPPFLLRREEEEAVLREPPDGTCASGTDCRYVTDLGFSLPGRALLWGACILCERRAGQRHYDSFAPEYPEGVLTAGAGVPYRLTDYDREGEGLAQRLPTPPARGVDLVAHGFQTRPAPAEEFFFLTCACARPPRMYVGVQRATGVEGCHYDIELGRVCCSGCKRPVARHESAGGVLELGGALYHLCGLCDTLVRRAEPGRLPLCAACTEHVSGRTGMHCEHCGTYLTPGDPQQAMVLDTGERVALCKAHAVRRGFRTREELREGLARRL